MCVPSPPPHCYINISVYRLSRCRAYSSQADSFLEVRWVCNFCPLPLWGPKGEKATMDQTLGNADHPCVARKSRTHIRQERWFFYESMGCIIQSWRVCLSVASRVWHFPDTFLPVAECWLSRSPAAKLLSHIQQRNRVQVWRLDWWLSNACNSMMTLSFHLNRCWIFTPQFSKCELDYHRSLLCLLYEAKTTTVILGVDVHILSVKLTALPTFKCILKYCLNLLSIFHFCTFLAGYLKSPVIYHGVASVFLRALSETYICWWYFCLKPVFPTLTVLTFFCLLFKKGLVNDSMVQSIKPNFISSKVFLRTFSYIAKGLLELSSHEKLTRWNPNF